MATMLDRYSTVVNNASSNNVDYTAYCPVCSPACDGRHYGLYTSCQQTVTSGTATVSNCATGVSNSDTAVVRTAAGRVAVDPSSYVTASRPDLLRPVNAATTNKPVPVASAHHVSISTWSPQRSGSATSRRSLLSCSAPDLIELARLPDSTVADGGNEENSSDDENDTAHGRYCRSRFETTTLPQRHVRHASVVWCNRRSMTSPYGGARDGRATNMAATKKNNNNSHLITSYHAPENFCA